MKSRKMKARVSGNEGTKLRHKNFGNEGTDYLEMKAQTIWK